METSEITIPLPSGLTLRGITFGEKPTIPGSQCILALHGWLDNAGTYVNIGPALAEEGYYIVCLDLMGHGLSDHRPAGQFYYLWDYVDEVALAVDYLGWKEFTLMGHSMGGHISIIYAGTFPERVSHLIIIESLGPYFTFTDDPFQMRKYLIKRREVVEEKTSFPSRKEACEVRSLMGLSPLSFHAAELLAERGLGEVKGSGEGDVVRYAWRSDVRLRLRQFLRWDEGGIRNFIAAVPAPTLLIFGNQSSIVTESVFKSDLVKGRINSFKKAVVVRLKGDHHCHLEEDTCEAVSEALIDFLEQ
ncbi:hypothetical protein HK098_005568 [Nowakowskiella sp. JEL0407]|nr:hypothetical protein HK098_005568 [Nowakowskiella sp. JEL0407]